MKDKSKGDEKNFFTKEDQKALQSLLKKMQNQTKVLEKDEDKHADALKKVLKDHKINADEHKDFFDALLEWRKKIWASVNCWKSIQLILMNALVS